MTLRDIGYDEALALTLERLQPLSPVKLPVWEASGLVLGSDAVAEVDSPSVTASTKDGYALRSADAGDASPEHPVELRLNGVVYAGGESQGAGGGKLGVEPGTAVEVTTGAPLPDGADAVVASEFTSTDGEMLTVTRDATPGRNLLRRGTDVAVGQAIAPAGILLTPAMTGLLAAGGLDRVSVVPRPRVAVLATGDEVVAPGEPLRSGQLYASNLVTLRSWLGEFRMASRSEVVRDDPAELRRVLASLLVDADVVLTSGGAWNSVRDFSTAIVEELGGEIVYHRVRLAPGKAVAFGLVDGKVVFCLPGGPPSNEMAFLQLALPGLLRLAGREGEPFRTVKARVAQGVSKNYPDPTWTSFYQACLSRDGTGYVAEPERRRSRLLCQARSNALIKIPAGTLSIDEGAEADVQLLTPAPR